MKRAALLTIITASAFLWCGQVNAHPGGRDAKGGHTNSKTGEYHYHQKSATATEMLTREEDTPVADDEPVCERPKHNPKLDVVWVEEHGLVAPYTCRTFDSVKDVDIEHIVAFAEARRSGLECSEASGFVNDMLNITVAFPKVNRHEKSDKDIADWQPQRNVCWFAGRVKAVKEKYGLTYDDRERQALENVLEGCSEADQEAWSCPAEDVAEEPEVAEESTVSQ